MLRWLQWRHVKPHVEVTVTLGGAYFVYYFTNAYLASSGVEVWATGVAGRHSRFLGVHSEAVQGGGQQHGCCVGQAKGLGLRFPTSSPPPAANTFCCLLLVWLQ